MLSRFVTGVQVWLATVTRGIFHLRDVVNKLRAFKTFFFFNLPLLYRYQSYKKSGNKYKRTGQ